LAELLNKVTQGDCLEVSGHVESGSVDLILTDLPYGNMKNSPSTWDKEKMKWDMTIDPKDVFEIANRILRKNGKMILFSQEPYTTRLINDSLPNIPFSYRAIWEKDTFANALGVNKAMVGLYEDILVFSKTHETERIHPLRHYARQVHEFIGIDKEEIIKHLGMVKVNFLRYSDTQFALCPLKTYEKLIEIFNIDMMPGFKNYQELKQVDEYHKASFPSTFNLWEGRKYKSNILKYKKDYDGFHPTQKPVLLLEDLIKTFSNEGDLVVDLTCGSGSTGVSAINTGRQFIGIERESEYVEIANKRIKDAITANIGR
jgi:DNA modification methylase